LVFSGNRHIMTRSNPFAIFTAIVALIAIVLGAVVTSLERPIAVTPALQIPAVARSFEFWHHMAAGIAVVLMVVLAITLRSQLAWIGLAAGIADGLLGITHQASASILHALLAQIFFGCIVAIAVTTSPAWKRGPDPIDDTWRPSLRSLAIAVPAVILLQTTLGASYRYHALGVLWHILGAMIVLMLNLIVSVFLIRQFPQHPTLKPAAVTLAVLTGIQVLLGFTTLMLLIIIPDESSAAIVIASVLHVTNGALTFAAGLALSILIRYNIRKTQDLPVAHN
jgi:heme A synthase